MIREIAYLSNDHQEDVLKFAAARYGLRPMNIKELGGYDLTNYGIIHQTWDLNNLSEARQGALNKVKNRHENEICIVETDFNKFLKYTTTEQSIGK